MRFLVDTHLLIWSAIQTSRLSATACELLNDPANSPTFSVVSLWEMAIKRGLERRDFDLDPRVLRRTLHDSGYEELPVTGEHALAVETLPLLHRDPFDRILIAQASVQGIVLLTADPKVAQYPGPIRQV